MCMYLCIYCIQNIKLASTILQIMCYAKCYTFTNYLLLTPTSLDIYMYHVDCLEHVTCTSL